MSDLATAPAPVNLGLNVLLVEDDEMLASMLIDAMEALGCTVTRAARVREGSRLAEDSNTDIAVLDVNVAGEEVFPVAATLDKRGVPFVFVTAYIRTGIPDAFAKRPILYKPFHLADLERTLRTLGRPH
jgi:DNA-binding response OmpR family regulator